MSEQNQNSNNMNNKLNNKTKKLGKDIAKKVIKLILKLVKTLFKFILTAILPYFLVFLFFVLLCYGAWDLLFNSKGLKQKYTPNTIAGEENKVELNDETGEEQVVDLSISNKYVKAFYTYFSEKSLYATVTDKNGKVTQKEPLQYNSPEFISKYGAESNRVLKDKYDREKMFYLNPNALWSLDEYLHEKQFRYPEQFIKPVYHDKETFELKQLTTDSGTLTAKSGKYKQNPEPQNVYEKNGSNEKVQVYIDNVSNKDTFESKTNGKQNKPKLAVDLSMIKDSGEAIGLWDYGFGSILNYKEFEEEKKGVGSFISMSLWDSKKGEMLYNVGLESAEELCKADPERYQGFNPEYTIDKRFEDKLPSSTSYMIDRVTSPAGFITNDIKFDWEDSGRKYVKTVTFEKEVSTWTIVEKQATLFGIPIFIDINGHETYKEYSKDSNGSAILNDKKMETVKTEKKSKKTFKIDGEGTEYEKIPRYDGEPDISQVTGQKYFIDYMLNYKTYVPDNVMIDIGTTDFVQRTGVEHDKLLKLLDRQSFSNKTGGKVDLSCFKLGESASNQSFMNAMQYIKEFELWGETYGIDPYLLVAIASQESGGVHSLSNCSSGGCGLMQVEKPGVVIKSAVARNMKTGKDDTLDISSIDSVSNINDNIRAGAMLQSGRMRDSHYNMLFGLQAYNFGTGALKLAVEKYAVANGKTFETVLNDNNDVGWMANVSDLHAHPNNYLKNKWTSSAVCNIAECPEKGSTNHYGDPGYIQHVLQYYVNPSGEFPWVINDAKQKIFMDGSSFHGGTATPGGSNVSWDRKSWEQFRDKKNEVFPLMPIKYSDKTVSFENKLPSNQALITYKMMFAMEEQKLLSEYDDFKDDDWKEKFAILFSNPIGTKWIGSGGEIDSKGMFPDGFCKPLESKALVIEDSFKLPTQLGVTITSANDTKVVAVSSGRVVKVSKKATKDKGVYIEIVHSSGATTIYGGLGNVYVKEGDVVKLGQRIAETGNSYKKNSFYLELNYQGKTIDPTWIISGYFNVGDYNISPEDSKIIERVIQLAYTKIGCIYTQEQGLRSGPNSFDCSGFVWWLYHETSGKNIGSWTNEQDEFLNNHRVNYNKIQPGDILMPNDRTHVVLYIGKENGKDVYIHAAGSKYGVIKSSISNISKKYPKIYRPMSLINKK